MPGLEFDFTIDEIMDLIDAAGERNLSAAEHAKLKAVTIAMANAYNELDED